MKSWNTCDLGNHSFTATLKTPAGLSAKAAGSCALPFDTGQLLYSYSTNRGRLECCCACTSATPATAAADPSDALEPHAPFDHLSISAGTTRTLEQTSIPYSFALSPKLTQTSTRHLRLSAKIPCNGQSTTWPRACAAKEWPRSAKRSVALDLRLDSLSSASLAGGKPVWMALER